MAATHPSFYLRLLPPAVGTVLRAASWPRALAVSSHTGRDLEVGDCAVI